MKLWQTRQGHRTGKRGPGRPTFAQGVHHQSEQVGQVLYGETTEARTQSSTGPVVQAKLTVGAPDDRYEREADWMADRVMDGEGADRGVHLINTDAAQRMCEECEEEEEEAGVQAKAESGAGAPSHSAGVPSPQGGHPMPGPLQHRFSSGFGRDLSPVRVHTHAQADQQARNLNAKAFTYGQDIYFRQGYYQPGTRQGQWLLAHELTHTLQQDTGQRLKTLDDSDN
ncbi:eCIS core domain-containing protein [Saccharospirillum salsuginis]|uniref:eCIS core domain-containing protein n=1 Tax=Saccharospirillum salsuginis TaxID=418750 RepID=A0A918JYY4_9GAMM|nr:DUF4157 domain-containing protein [Saccharospirillum salsuginis]GGX38996.1 hypothetical protein GCM10007392_01600 [Saccharospirillum salsuginis]